MPAPLNVSPDDRTTARGSVPETPPSRHRLWWILAIASLLIGSSLLLGSFLDGDRAKQGTVTVVQTIEYHRPDAQEVLMIWGINGWNPIPEALRPPGTRFDKAMKSPMVRRGEVFSISLTVPARATIDFGFLITKSGSGFPLTVWEDRGSGAFQKPAVDGTVYRIDSAVKLTQSGRLPTQESRETLAGIVVVFLMGSGLLSFLGFLAHTRRRPLYTAQRAFYRRKRLPAGVVWCLVPGSVIAALALSEFLLRSISPYGHFGAARELSWTRLGSYDFTKVFAVDPEIGTKPTLADRSYDHQWGTVKNSYSATKPAGVSRLLFLGNAVTRNGALIDPLKARYGETGYEYWNGGVTSYNTIQSIRLFLRQSAQLSPDHVILTIQPDDIETIPIAFLNDAMQLILYAPNAPMSARDRWLFSQSHLYRFFLGLTFSRRGGEGAILEEIRRHLAALKQHLDRRHAKLTVLVMPLLCPEELWDDEERNRRSALIRILADLQIRSLDLAAPVASAIAEGIPLHEKPGNLLLPSPQVAEVMAGFLREQELL